MHKQNENIISPLKINRIMLGLWLVFALFICSSSTFGQVTVNVQNQTIKQTLRNIEHNTVYKFFYSDQLTGLDKVVSLNVKNQTIEVTLSKLFSGTQLSYTKKENNQFVIFTKSATLTSSQQEYNERKIVGTVKDEKGEPIIGANVVEKGTTNGIITDADGEFVILMPSKSTLIISYIGYITQEVQVGSKTAINIIMKEDTKALDEVVVVGYGTMKKSDLTGAITNVNQENIKNMTTATIDQKLVGQIPGVQIQQVSGAPGSGTSIKIRGAGSIGAGNDPLYVIDEMPYSSGFNQNINPLNFINPENIESITVLKDASSTAIYGSRGANGVIMITTKKGNFDKTEVNVSSRFGIQQVPEKGKPKMMNQYEFADYQREKIGIAVYKMEKRGVNNADYPSEYLPENLHGKGTDWYDLILRTAITQDHNISVNKGSKDSRLNFSLGYYNQEGVLKYTGLERYSGKLTMESKINKAIRIGASLQPTLIKQNRTNVASSRDDIIAVATWANPVMKPYDEYGNLIPYIYSPKSKYHTAWGFMNPLYTLRETVQKEEDFQNLGVAFLELEVIPGLKAKTTLNTNFSYNKYFNYKPSTIGGSNNPPKSGTGSSSNVRGQSFNWLIENTISYNKLFKNKHQIDALLGYTAQRAKNDDINIYAYPYSDDLIQTINAAQAINSWGQTINEWSMISYLGRINYVYDNKYLLTATFRSDGSSRFGPKKRYATFPSVAAAWRISEENFIKGNSDISNLKLRLSLGKSGNNNIGNYAHLASISAGNYIFNNTQVTGSVVGISNPYLTWEESSQVDAGFDLGLFDNKISVNFDYYYRKSIDMLLSDRIPAITGFNSQTVNKGNVRNTGFEFSMNAIPLQGKFTWNINFNLSLNRNKVISINGEKDARILSGNCDGLYSNITMVDKPIGQLYGYIFDGLYTADDLKNPNIVKYPTAYEGAVRYKDLNGDGSISSPADFDIIGNPQPDFIYGLTNSFSYNNIDVTIVMNGQYGGDVVNGLRQTIDNLQGYFNVSEEWVKRWRSKENPGDGFHYGIPASAPSYGHKISNLWIEDASYLRISNLSIGYTLPRSVIHYDGFVKNCRLYLSAQNLATFTKYSGNNPEGKQAGNDNTLAAGFDMTSYPLARAISLGLNISF